MNTITQTPHAARMYQQKTEKIEAMQWNGTLAGMVEINNTLDPYAAMIYSTRLGKKDGVTHITMEADMRVFEGDWVIKRNGSLWAVEKELFASLYEPQNQADFVDTEALRDAELQGARKALDEVKKLSKVESIDVICSMLKAEDIIALTPQESA